MRQMLLREAMSTTFVIIDVRSEWRPIARLLQWRWRRAGYHTAYQPISSCTALVAAVLYKRTT